MKSLFIGFLIRMAALNIPRRKQNAPTHDYSAANSDGVPEEPKARTDSKWCFSLPVIEGESIDSQNSINREVQKVLDQAQYKKIRFHDLHHLYIKATTKNTSAKAIILIITIESTVANTKVNCASRVFIYNFKAFSIEENISYHGTMRVAILIAISCRNDV